MRNVNKQEDILFPNTITALASRVTCLVMVLVTDLALITPGRVVRLNTMLLGQAPLWLKFHQSGTRLGCFSGPIVFPRVPKLSANDFRWVYLSESESFCLSTESAKAEDKVKANEWNWSITESLSQENAPEIMQDTYHGWNIECYRISSSWLKKQDFYAAQSTSL